MSDPPRVILSGFADEAANQKTAEQQFAAFAALGLQYYTIRFVDAGSGMKNVMELSKSEISKSAASGGRIRAECLFDRLAHRQGEAVGRGRRTKNRFVPFKQYLAKDVKSVRNGPRLRDETDPRLLVLSSPGDRPARARCRRWWTNWGRSPRLAIAAT